MTLTARSLRLLDEATDLAREIDRPSDAVLSLRQRLQAGEWLILLVGETGRGKSTWLNSLLCERVLPASPGATTSVPVEIRFTESEEPQFLGREANGSICELNLSRFQQSCRRVGQFDRLQMTWPLQRVQRHGVDPERLRGLAIIDAPGYNAVIAEHNEILLRVLPDADATVFMLGARHGFGVEDARFLKLMIAAGDAGTVLLPAVNWLPGKDVERRLAEMRKQYQAASGRLDEFYLLESRRDAGQLTIWSEALWSRLEQLAAAPNRIARTARSVVWQLRLLLTTWQIDLGTRQVVASADEQELQALRNRLAEFDTQVEPGCRVIENAFNQMVRLIEQREQEFRTKLLAEARQEIENANRWISGESCTEYVRTQLVPRTALRLYDTLHRELLAIVDQADRQVEGYAMPLAVEGLTLPNQSVAPPTTGYDWFDQEASRKLNWVVDIGLKKASRKASQWLFSQILKSKATTEVAARMFYMGATYLYNVATWKDKFHEEVDRKVPEVLHAAASVHRTAVNDWHKASLDAFMDNHRCRSDALLVALAERAEGYGATAAKLLRWRGQLDRLIADCEAVLAEKDYAHV